MTEAAAQRGLLISFDGLDCSGKATQTRILSDRLRHVGWTVHKLQTPDYETESGKELKLRLQNKIGNWQETPWEEKLGYFAKNRAENREEVVEALKRGEIVVYDRYVPSSLTFMVVEALEPHEVALRREEVYQAVRKAEYEDNGMPKEDVSIFLDVPPQVSLNLLEDRKARRSDEDEYTDHLFVQERLYNEYDWLTKQDPTHYIRTKCVMDGQMVAIEEVSELVWAALLQRFPHIEKK